MVRGLGVCAPLGLQRALQTLIDGWMIDSCLLIDDKMPQQRTLLHSLQREKHRKMVGGGKAEVSQTFQGSWVWCILH